MALRRARTSQDAASSPPPRVPLARSRPAPLLAGCGNAPAVTTGSTSTSELAKIMPAYAPLNVGDQTRLPEHRRLGTRLPELSGHPGPHGQRDAGQRQHLHRDRAGLGRDPAHRRQHLLPGAECRARREHAVAADQRHHDHHHPAHAVRGQPAARLDRGADLGAAAGVRPGHAEQARRPYPLPRRGQDQAVPEPGGHLQQRLAAGHLEQQDRRHPHRRVRLRDRRVPVLPGGHPGQARHRHAVGEVAQRPVRPRQGDQRPQGQALGVRRHLAVHGLPVRDNDRSAVRVDDQ